MVIGVDPESGPFWWLVQYNLRVLLYGAVFDPKASMGHIFLGKHVRRNVIVTSDRFITVTYYKSFLVSELYQFGLEHIVCGSNMTVPHTR